MPQGWFSGSAGLVRKRTCIGCNKPMSSEFFSGEIDECSDCAYDRHKEEQEDEHERQRYIDEQEDVN